MVIRPFPIRIATGNYGDSNELSWEQISEAAAKGNYPLPTDESEGNFTRDFTEKPLKMDK